MTTKELREKTNIQWCGYGQYKVTITYKGREYSCHSNNSPAYDRIDDPDHGERWEYCGYTNHKAWQAFYDECKRKNNLC